MPAVRLRELVHARARARPPPFPQASLHDQNQYGQAQTYYNVPAAPYPRQGESAPGGSNYPVTGGVGSPTGSYPTQPVSPFPPSLTREDFPAFNFDELGLVTSRSGQDEFGQAEGRGLLDMPLITAGFGGVGGGAGGGGQALGATDSSSSFSNWMDWSMLDESAATGNWHQQGGN